jgi:hypothetical protein
VASRTCPRCGSSLLRRSHPHGAWKRLVRATTPLRRFACEGCGHHGWTLARLPRVPESEPNGETTGRLLERRDLRAHRRRRLRVLLLVALAVIFGLLAARLAAGPGDPGLTPP